MMQETMVIDQEDLELIPTLKDLEIYANEMRIEIIRMLHAAGSGHPGGSLSAIDLITVIFYNYLRRTKENASDSNRHRFVLSKGHGVPALYAVLSKLGIIPPNELLSLRKVGSRLQGHPNNTSFPAVEASTGSLGQGLSIAQGMAMAAKLDDSDARVYCLIGDGEFQEGQIWEAVMSAPKFKLDNLIVLLDSNKGQIDGPTQEVMNIEPIALKVTAFNWEVQHINGHDFRQIDTALQKAQSQNGKPHFIIADTVKGKGVSFMEGVIDWHGKAPSDVEAQKAISELTSKLGGLQ